MRAACHMPRQPAQNHSVTEKRCRRESSATAAADCACCARTLTCFRRGLGWRDGSQPSATHGMRILLAIHNAYTDHTSGCRRSSPRGLNGQRLEAALAITRVAIATGNCETLSYVLRRFPRILTHIFVNHPGCEGSLRLDGALAKRNRSRYSSPCLYQRDAGSSIFWRHSRSVSCSIRSA